MKRFIAIALVGLISGCSVFQKTTHNGSSSLNEVKSVSHTSDINVDSTKRESTEKWKLTVPGINNANLQDFHSPVTPDLTGMTDQQKADFLEMQKTINALRNAQINNTGYTLEWEKKLSEALNKTQSTQKIDSTSNKKEDKLDTTIKEPIKIPWLTIILGAVAAGIAGGLIPNFLPGLITRILK
ncbi:MAG TPA: hypothetical protein VGC08_08705 [Pedobacter sp.]